MIGGKIIHLLSVGSTNSYAQHLLSLGACPEGTVVVTSEQSFGRGMQGNSWESERGCNLTFSVILYPDFVDMNYVFVLNQVIALGVCEFLKEVSGEQFKVKWPNDVMFGNMKISGILLENNLRGNYITSSVAGIGININQTRFFEYTPQAASLKLITGNDYNLEQMLRSVCRKLNDYYDILKQGSHNFIHQEYHRNLFRYNEMHLFQKDNIYFKGVIKGVMADGKLLMADEAGTRQVIDVKEMKFVY